MDYQRTDPIIHMHVEMEWVLPGAYEPPKAAKECAATDAIKIQIQAQYFPTYIMEVHIYWNWLLPYTYTDSHA